MRRYFNFGPIFKTVRHFFTLVEKSWDCGLTHFFEDETRAKIPSENQPLFSKKEIGKKEKSQSQQRL